MTKEHTPTPWTATKAKFPIDGEFDWAVSVLIGGRRFCICEAFGRCATSILLPAEENAEFIVRACNAHDELVSCLTTLLAAWRIHVPEGIDAPIACDADSILSRARSLASQE